jgi:RNA polymerase sigma-70 factor (ECF subfamily)
VEEAALAQSKAEVREARFTVLVKAHLRFVFQVAYAILRNRQDAEDAAQETFLKLYRTHSWESIDNPRAFLARAAWRVAVDRLPKRRAESLRADWPVQDSSTPEDAVVAADWQAAVHRLLDALPEELRQPLALWSVQELGSREIALVLGIAEGTVRTRIMRARQMLRKKLEALMEGRHAK